MYIYTEQTPDPVQKLLRFFHGAKAATVLPRAAGFSNAYLSTNKWKVPEVDGPLGISPSAVPSAPATLPVSIESDGKRLVISHWADSAASGRDNVKFWGGSAETRPPQSLAKWLSAIASSSTDDLESLSRDPFAFAVKMTGGFRFDWRRDYIPLDAGFSPNNHGNVAMIGYPVTELLAAIGLQHARPSASIDATNFGTNMP